MDTSSQRCSSANEISITNVLLLRRAVTPRRIHATGTVEARVRAIGNVRDTRARLFERASSENIKYATLLIDCYKFVSLY